MREPNRQSSLPQGRQDGCAAALGRRGPCHVEGGRAPGTSGRPRFAVRHAAGGPCGWGPVPLGTRAVGGPCRPGQPTLEPPMGDSKAQKNTGQPFRKGHPVFRIGPHTAAREESPGRRGEPDYLAAVGTTQTLHSVSTSSCMRILTVYIASSLRGPSRRTISGSTAKPALLSCLLISGAPIEP